MGNMGFYITEETGDDRDGVRSVNVAAFGSRGEADVVDQLRENCPVFLSLIAKNNERVIGHVLFTPVRLIQDQDWSIEGMGLAPLAVLPAYQNMGVGSELCKEGLQQVEEAGYPYVVVLGDPSYYHRFGFETARDYGIKSSFEDVPQDAFMIKIFDSKVMEGAQGVVYYREEFDSVT